MKTISRLFLKTACLLGLASCASQPGPADPHRELENRVARRRELAVLFVGNSYSFGVPRAFEEICAEHGKSVRTGHATTGGWSLARHAAAPGTLRKIRSGNWDIVALQEFSETPALPRLQRDLAMLPPLHELVAEIRQAGAIPLLVQTWGRQRGNPKLAGDDFTAMTERLRQGTRAAAKSAGNLVIVPAGDRWEREVNAGRAAELFQPDGSHPTPTGNRTTAEAFYRTIFGSEE